MTRAKNSHKTIMNLIKPGASKVEKYFGWKLPLENAFKLNTDKAHKKMNMAAAGGLIRNDNGDLVAAFCANIGISSVTNDELWGLFYSLDLAWRLGVRNCWLRLIASTLLSCWQTRAIILIAILLQFKASGSWLIRTGMCALIIFIMKQTSQRIFSLTSQ